MLYIYIYIYILVIGNIMNKSLFIQVEIAKNLLLLGKITTIIFIKIRFYFSFALHLKVIFYFSFYKYIV